MDLIPISLEKIMQSKAYTVFLMNAPEKKFVIYTLPTIGDNIQRHLMDQKKPRPQTHDLCLSLFDALGIKVLQIVIWDVKDTIYFTRLYLEQTIGDKKHVIEIDARPSDALTFALETDAPLFCKKELLEKVESVSI